MCAPLAPRSSGPAGPPGGSGNGGHGDWSEGSRGDDNDNDGNKDKDKNMLLVCAAAAVAVSAAFALVPAARAAGEEEHEGNTVEQMVETALFSTRFLVLLAVAGAIAMSAAMFAKGITTVSKAWMAFLMGKSSDMGIKAVESLDEFLTGCASLVFGMGLFELFISKMHIADPEDEPEAYAKAHKGGFNLGHRPEWLALDGLGDLKHRTGAVIVMIMIVNIFEHGKKMAVTSPVDLVYLGGAALLSAMSISLMGVEFNQAKKEEKLAEKH
jgi:uncharacterized membrane protein YqhA